MRRSSVPWNIQLSPDAADDGGGGGGGVGGPPNSLANFMAGLPDVDLPGTPPAAAAKKDDPAAQPKVTDGKTDTGGRPPVDGSGTPPPVANAPTADPAKAPEQAPAAPKAEPAPVAAKAADAAPKEPDAPTEEDKWPRSAADWDKFKTKRKEREEQLRGQITQLTEREKQLTTKVQEFEARSAELPPEVKTKIDAQEKLIKEMTDQIAILDVTADPRWKTYFGEKESAIIGEAKQIVGAEKATSIENIIKLPDGEYKKTMLSEFVSELNEPDRIELYGVIRDLRKLDAEKQQALKNANDSRDKIVGERQTKAQAVVKGLETAFDTTVRQLQDPEKGYAVFQKRNGEGTEAWNADVDRRIEVAKSMLFGKNMDETRAVRTVLDAVAMPVVARAYASARKVWAEEKATLTAQIAALTAAKPAGKGAGATNGAGAPATTPTQLNRGMNPQDAIQHFAAGMVKAIDDE